jgi:hypothetical protein
MTVDMAKGLKADVVKMTTANYTVIKLKSSQTMGA